MRVRLPVFVRPNPHGGTLLVSLRFHHLTGTPHAGVDAFIRRGTIFLTVNDYLKVQHRLQSIYHRLEVLNPKVTA